MKIAMIILVILAIVCFDFYKWIGYGYYKKLRAIAGTATLGSFKKLLGTNYKYRHHEGYIRCKWILFWVVVKADFYDDEKLRSVHLRPFQFLSIRNRVTFEGKEEDQ